MLFIRRNFLLMIYCTYSKWLKRRAVRVLTSAESDCFHSSRRKSPATKPNVNTGNTLVSDVVDTTGVQFETIHVGDARFGYRMFYDIDHKTKVVYGRGSLANNVRFS